MARYTIVRGPSKLDCMLSLFDTDPKHMSGRREVSLTVLADGVSYTFEAILESITRRGDEDWEFKGWAYVRHDAHATVSPDHPIWMNWGMLSTKTRKGELSLEDCCQPDWDFVES